MTIATAQKSFIQPAAKREPSLPFRGDTLLGVCEAVGQDLGINPNWLRVPFAALLLWNPIMVVASYLALGIVVAITRWLIPVRAQEPKLGAVIAASPAIEPMAAEQKSKEKSEELLAA